MFWSITVLSLLCYAFYKFITYKQRYFERIGVPGPKPPFLWGHLTETLGESIPYEYQKWTKQYGKTFGVFRGTVPLMVTSDLDVLQDVFVKKFNCFHARQVLVEFQDIDHSETSHMFEARGLRWKRLRSISNPAFSVANMKVLLPLLNDSMDNFAQRLEAVSDKPLDIYPLFKALTMDVIARVSLGQEKSDQTPENEYLVMFGKQFGRIPTFTEFPFLYLGNMLPELSRFWRFSIRAFVYLSKKFNKNADSDMVAEHDIMTKLKELVTSRKNNRQASDGYTDFINLFLDAEAPDGWEKDNLKKSDVSEFQMNQLKVAKRLTVPEIIGQCFLFLIAGFETTSNTLACLSYELANHPEIQQKLQEEIDEHCPAGEVISYEAAHKLKYMSQVLKEALRMYPIASFVEARRCVATCSAGGVVVPEKCNVAADVLSLHYDKDVWGADADRFDPDRFGKAEKARRHPLAYMPFGAGPRVCIGQRFALLEAKMALCAILQRFTINKTPQTTLNLKLKNPGTLQPDNMTIKLERRE